MVDNLTTKCFMSLVLVSKENVPFRSSYPRKHVLSSVEGRVSRLIRRETNLDPRLPRE